MSAATTGCRTWTSASRLRVENWTATRTARASYRGAVWDVELAPGEQPTSGEFVIREIQANRLIVAAKPR